MNIHPRILKSILKKDLRGLMPLVVVTSGLIILEALIADIESTAQVWALIQLTLPTVSYFTCGILILAVFQQDPAASLSHDWLTRPIPSSSLLIAKFLFLFLTIVVPMILTRLIVNFYSGHSGIESIQEATVFERPSIMLLIPILMIVSILSKSLLQSIGVLIGLFLLLVIPTSSLMGVTMLSASPNAVSGGPNQIGALWIVLAPITIFLFGALVIVYWYQYRLRSGILARVAFGACIALSSLIALAVFIAPSWNTVFSILQSNVDNSAEHSLKLDPVYACFPSSVIGDIRDINRSDPSQDIIGASYWDDTQLIDAGPNAVSFSTTVASRDIPLDWRVIALNATATYSSAELESKIQLQPANYGNATADNTYSNATTHFWLIPEELKQQLSNTRSTQFTLDYSLGLLSPSKHELEIDDVRRYFPDLGYCSARLDSIKNQVIVDCFKRGSRPALVSAELLEVESSRVDAGYPDYSPGWFQAFGGRHYELIIDSPSLVSDPKVLLTAYEMRALFNKQVTSEGMLGGATELCPVPTSNQSVEFQQSSWRDSSSHETSFIAVEQGVRLEVLDWGGEGRTIVLLAGAGATAHSFDDLAPRLAEKYRVIGITRRGFGASSRPNHGYDIARLSEDVVQVLESLDLPSPVLVGHSFGGDELSTLAATYPAKFPGLVYLDAAYDRSKPATRDSELTRSLPPAPLPNRSTLASYETLKEHLELRESLPWPEGEFIASYDFSNSSRTYDPRLGDVLMAGVESPDYEAITAPALAIYAKFSSADKRMRPWYDENEPGLRDKVEEQYQLGHKYRLEQIAQFDERVAQSEVIVIEDGNHSIFLSHEDEVFKAMVRFIDNLN